MDNEKTVLPPIEELTIMRLPAVLAATGLSASRIYQLERAGKFPKRVSLGDNATGWLEFHIRRWIFDRVNTGAVKLTGALAPLTTRPAKSGRKGARA